jgi:hypothetical protein
MHKVLQVIGNLLLSSILGLGGLIMLTALPLDSDVGGLFYWGLTIATIPLLIWGRVLVGCLIRLPWHLFKLVHQHCWSALAFWVGLAFLGLPPPVAVVAFVFCSILASAKQQSHQPVRQFNDSDDDFWDDFDAIGASDGISSSGLATYGGIDDGGNTW